MFAAFFIDRPILSWVISIVILLMGAAAISALPVAQYPDITPPTVTVVAQYPGANAGVVADSVAAPIEQQISGVDKMLYMSSQCTNDGAYSLTVTFDLRTDPDINQVLVQNRVALAMPQLPQEVQVQGVTTKKKSPSILLVVNLISPDNSYDDLFLSNYATIQVKDELLRVKGVGDVNFLGQRDYSLRLWLNPERMAALDLSATDVVAAVRAQNVQVAAGQVGRQPVPTGQQFQLTMSTLGRLDEVEQFQNIVVKSGKPAADDATSTPVVRVRDVARVELGAQQYDQISRLSGRPTVGLALFQLPGSNALGVANDVRKKMEELKRKFPRGIDYRIVYDTTPFVKESINEVFKTLFEAVILVAIVVLLFLQDWKAMILPMIDVPVSLVGAFAVMAVLGFTLNTLTLFGLVLAIGIVVDDAIMVLENIERLIATGLNARDATIQSMAEITGPIIAVTLVLISVFLPAAFLPGVTGQFYKQFALTIAATMIISAINAMTLTPSRAVGIFKTADGHGGEHGGGQGGGHAHQREALPWWFYGILGAYLSFRFGLEFVGEKLGLPPEDAPERLFAAWWLEYAAIGIAMLPGLIAGGLLGLVIVRPINAVLAVFFRGFNWVFDRIAAGYGLAVGGLVRVSLLVLLVYGGLIYLTGFVMTTAPKGFIPDQDQGYLLVNVQLPDSASVQRTQAVLERIERIALGDDTGKYFGAALRAGAKKYPGVPGVGNTVAVAGQSFLLNAAGSNFGSCFVVLDSFKSRTGHHEEYDALIARKLTKLYAEEIPEAVVGVFRAPPIQGLGNAGGLQLQVQQRGFVDLQELQTTTDELVQGVRKGGQVAAAFTLYRAQTPQLTVDIDRVKCESLGLNFNDVFGTLQVYMGGAYVNLFNKFGRSWQVNIMADDTFRTDAGVISQLKVRNRTGEMVPLGSVAAVRDRTGPVFVMRYNMYTSAAVNAIPRPGVSSGVAIAGIEELAAAQNTSIEWTQITFLQLREGSAIFYALGLGSLLVFLVLAAQYESWSLPFAIILVVPMSILCAVTGMLVARLPVDIFVQIGFLVLVALAAKNAILIVEFAHQYQQQGKGRHEAIVEACKVRLRPIIMTSAAFTLGVVPLVLGHGAGAEMRRSLGTAVFSGMIGVTGFGLFLTPVFYYFIMGFVRDKGPHGPSLAPAGAAPVTPLEALPVSPPSVPGGGEGIQGRPGV